MELTFERQAEISITDVLSFEPATVDEEAAMWHAYLFLVDYEVALNSDHTTEEHFLAAYSNRALSIRHSKPEERKQRAEALDGEAYRIRQQWRKGKGAI